LHDAADQFQCELQHFTDSEQLIDMKNKLVIAFILLVAAGIGYRLAAQQTAGGQVNIVASNPTTCTLGGLYFNTNTGQLLPCIATNTLGTAMPAVFTGTTGSIGGGALLAGTCASGTVAVTNSLTGNAVLVSPNTYPGDGIIWYGYVSVNGTVTVKVCSILALTPTAGTYNVKVIQ
jgi:hypothetical protein